MRASASPVVAGGGGGVTNNFVAGFTNDEIAIDSTDSYTMDWRAIGSEGATGFEVDGNQFTCTATGLYVVSLLAQFVWAQVDDAADVAVAVLAAASVADPNALLNQLTYGVTAVLPLSVVCPPSGANSPLTLPPVQFASEDAIAFELQAAAVPDPSAGLQAVNWGLAIVQVG